MRRCWPICGHPTPLLAICGVFSRCWPICGRLPSVNTAAAPLSLCWPICGHFVTRSATRSLDSDKPSLLRAMRHSTQLANAALPRSSSDSFARRRLSPQLANATFPLACQCGLSLCSPCGTPVARLATHLLDGDSPPCWPMRCSP